MIDLDTLDTLVGKYVHIERPRTKLERMAYGDENIPEGGAGWVTEVRPVENVTVTYDGWSETQRGRMVVFDYGMGWLVTSSSEIIWREDEPSVSG